MSEPLSSHNAAADCYRNRTLLRHRGSVVIKTETIAARPAPHELLIAMELGALCRTDLFVADGTRGTLTTLTLGHEAAGTVVEAGSFCTLSPGTRVVINPLRGCQKCRYCMADKIHLCRDQSFIGLTKSGCFSQYYSCPETSVFPISDSLSWQEASYLEPVAAALAVMDYPYSPFDRVAVIGSNRIALLVQQILEAYGIEATIICPKTSQDHSSAETNCYDVVIETIPEGSGLELAVSLLKPRGTLIVKSRPEHAVPVDLNQLLAKEVRIMACAYGCFQKAKNLLEEGRVCVSQYCSTVFPFDAHEEAFETARRDERYKYFLALR